MRFKFPKAVFVLLLCLLAFPASSQDVRKAKIEDLLRDVFYVSGLHLPPMIFKSTQDNQATSGIIADLTREILKRTGHRVEFRISNWARAIKEVEFGVADAVMPTMKSPDREVFLRFPQLPILVLNYVLIAREGTSLSYKGDLQDLEGYRILKLRQGRVTPAFDQAIDQGLLNVEERDDFSQLVKGVALGRAELGTISNYNLFWILKNENLHRRIQVLDPPLGHSPVYLALSRNSTDESLRHRISEVIADMIADGTYARVLTKYIGDTADIKKLTDQILAYRN